MRSKLFKTPLLIVVLTLMVTSVLPAAGGQGGGEDAKKYVGVWAGSVTRANGDTHELSYILKKDEKGQWGGTVKWANQNGEQSADFNSLQIADGKMKGKFEAQDGQVEATLEGQFQGDKLEGTFVVYRKGSTEV